ncbi:MAG: nucleotidyltransferase domain-containing protein, partial [Eggerthellaceae bacterium]|nr:nucleotidyltransferase domain-containing protein [Eggerthellaceae bacterium]
DADDINLPHEVLERLVQRITEAVPKQDIYIFGSYARGEEHTDSDIDIYVATREDKKKTMNMQLMPEEGFAGWKCSKIF